MKDVTLVLEKKAPRTFYRASWEEGGSARVRIVSRCLDTKTVQGTVRRPPKDSLPPFAFPDRVQDPRPRPRGSLRVRTGETPTDTKVVASTRGPISHHRGSLEVFVSLDPGSGSRRPPLGPFNGEGRNQKSIYFTSLIMTGTPNESCLRLSYVLLWKFFGVYLPISGVNKRFRTKYGKFDA